MTTTTKKRSKNKSTKKSNEYSMPPTASVAVIEGKEFVIIPLDDFEDLLLSAIVRERMEDGSEFVPFEEIEKRLDAKNRKKGK